VEDFASLLPLVPFPYLVQPAGAGIAVAAGTLVGLDELASMTGVGAGGAQQDLATFLKQLPSDADVFVTGHSLGGCLASVVAAWLASVFGNAARLKAYTFAAPSAGNQAFADYYNALFTDSKTSSSTAYRIYNTLDSVPNAWASLATILTYYTPSPLCPDYIKDIVGDAEWDVGSEYVQVGTAAGGSAVALQGTVVPWSSWWDLDPTGTAQFAHQVGEQHATSTYLGLLAGTPAVAATVKLAAMGARAAVRRLSRANR
jgi:pimeloyl-ACP methyl ester carboxylesterase